MSTDQSVCSRCGAAGWAVIWNPAPMPWICQDCVSGVDGTAYLFTPEGSRFVNNGVLGPFTGHASLNQADLMRISGR